MATSSNQESLNYGTRIPIDEAEKVEAFRERNDLNKSEAIRVLVQAGLAERNRRARFFERATLQIVSIVITASLVLAVSTFIVFAAMFTGILVGVDPGAVLAFAGLVGGVLFLTAIASWTCYRIGFAEWVDEQVNTFAIRLGIEP